MNPQEIRNAADVMREGWRIALGRAPNEGELLYSLLVARLETSFGRGWTGPLAASNNWGAIQCGANAIAQGAKCIERDDTHPNGTKYKVGFRAYPSPAEGAADVVRHLTKYRPGVAAVMSRNGSLSEFARAMREEKYYGGFCPEATKAGGKWGYGKPQNPNQVACHEEAIRGYVKGTSKMLSQIADAIGVPAPPVDAPKATSTEPASATASAWWPWALGAATLGAAVVYWRRS